MAKDLAIVLSSGSLASLVCAGLTAQRYRLVMINAQMTSKPNRRLRQAYEQQVQFFKPLREHTIDLTLLESIDVRRPGDARPAAEVASKLTELLPLTAIAARFAAHYQASAVAMGVRASASTDELARVTEFGQVFGELIQMACGLGDCEVQLPLADLEEWQMVDLGFQLGLPMDRGWSCHDDVPHPCGSCTGCRARAASFIRAAKPDPLFGPATLKDTPKNQATPSVTLRSRS